MVQTQQQETTTTTTTTTTTPSLLQESTRCKCNEPQEHRMAHGMLDLGQSFNYSDSKNHGENNP
uniref:Uncharacterized protein n=1 Tax=Oryza punctata TaxID=4537 RepID=A0A0E0L769_ORYPU